MSKRRISVRIEGIEIYVESIRFGRAKLRFGGRDSNDVRVLAAGDTAIVNYDASGLSDDSPPETGPHGAF